MPVDKETVFLELLHAARASSRENITVTSMRKNPGQMLDDPGCRRTAGHQHV